MLNVLWLQASGSWANGNPVARCSAQVTYFLTYVVSKQSTDIVNNAYILMEKYVLILICYDSKNAYILRQLNLDVSNRDHKKYLYFDVKWR